jgi:hypothetical protein
MAKEVKTSTLIHELAQDLWRPSETKKWPAQFWISWGAWFVLYGIATYFCSLMWPQIAHLQTQLLSNASFEIVVGLWLLASLAFAHATYESAFPIWSGRSTKKIALALMAALVLWAFASWSPSQFQSELAGELRADRGSCGRFVMIMGVFSTAWMFFVMRRAAPTKLLQAGAWAAASSASVGLLYMHLVCPYENTLHLLIWHFLPLAGLSFAGSITAKKALAW